MAGQFSLIPAHDSHEELKFDAEWTAPYQRAHLWSSSKSHLFLKLICLFSCSLNIYYFSGLYRDTPTLKAKHSEFDSANRTIEDLAWRSPDLVPEVGTLAIDKSWAAAKGLLPSQSWPWDDTKAVYLLESYHHIHCLHALRGTLTDAYSGAPLRSDQEHVRHCLNVLLQGVLCNAEDNLLYTGRLNDEAHVKNPSAGIGSVKMCRSWSKLRAFAVRNSACYGFPEDPQAPAEDMFKFCPDGSKPWEKDATSQGD